MKHISMEKSRVPGANHVWQLLKWESHLSSRSLRGPQAQPPLRPDYKCSCSSGTGNSPAIQLPFRLHCLPHGTLISKLGVERMLKVPRGQRQAAPQHPFPKDRAVFLKLSTGDPTGPSPVGVLLQGRAGSPGPQTAASDCEYSLMEHLVPQPQS